MSPERKKLILALAVIFAVNIFIIQKYKFRENSWNLLTYWAVTFQSLIKDAHRYSLCEH